MTTETKNGKVTFPQVLISGKIIKINTIETNNGNLYEHVINLPSEEPEDYPPGLVVKCKRRIGNQGERVKDLLVHCSRRSYTSNGITRYNHDFWTE